jgi:hypothetical protein
MDMDPEQVGQLGSGKYIDALSRVEQRLTEKVRPEHFGPFIGK